MTQTSTRPGTDTVEQTARKLVHAARNADDPHAEAGRIVTGLWPAPDTYSRSLLAAIEALRPTCANIWHAAAVAVGMRCECDVQA